MASFTDLIRNPLKARFYLLTNLPSAFFSGLKIAEAGEENCTVTVPYRWFTRNPFRSTYFACLGMAAEMSTGVLAMNQVYRRNPPVSMLVVGMESAFFKKATGLTRFRCSDGLAIRSAVEQAILSGEPSTVRVRSLGTNAAGDPIAEFFITWSFKVKK